MNAVAAVDVRLTRHSANPNAPAATAYALTATGMRLAFASLEKLADWSHRMPSAVAVSRDGQTWRNYGSFSRLVARGNAVHSAYERADAHHGTGAKVPE